MSALGCDDIWWTNFLSLALKSTELRLSILQNSHKPFTTSGRNTSKDKKALDSTKCNFFNCFYASHMKMFRFMCPEMKRSVFSYSKEAFMPNHSKGVLDHFWTVDTSIIYSFRLNKSCNLNISGRTNATQVNF